jgi:hypothetical protein
LPAQRLSAVIYGRKERSWYSLADDVEEVAVGKLLLERKVVVADASTGDDTSKGVHRDKDIVKGRSSDVVKVDVGRVALEDLESVLSLVCTVIKSQSRARI